MKLAGLTKFSLLDYPNRISCVVFTQGCNFACPFCHNPEQIKMNKSNDGLSEKVFFDFLESRVGKLEAVVITGGEPCLQPDLLEFITKIKDLGFLLKLDSNGSRPDYLKSILDTGLVDYVAMDIKQTITKYSLAMGRDNYTKQIQESINTIQNSDLEYEFRTTVVPTIHFKEDILAIAKLIKGSRNYYLQEFRDIGVLSKDRFKNQELDFNILDLISKIKPYFQNFGLRGFDFSAKHFGLNQQTEDGVYLVD